MTNFTRQEIATILHALRRLRYGIYPEREGASCDHFDYVDILIDGEIDALCDRINPLSEKLRELSPAETMRQRLSQEVMRIGSWLAIVIGSFLLAVLYAYLIKGILGC